MSAVRRRQIESAGRECADALLPDLLKNPNDLVGSVLALQDELNGRLSSLEPVSDAEHLRAMDAFLARVAVLANRSCA